MELEDVHIEATTVHKQGIAGQHVEMHHEQHVHRHLDDGLEIIERAHLSQLLAKRSIEVFRRLAAEAKAHGTSETEVHFHEVELSMP